MPPSRVKLHLALLVALAAVALFPGLDRHGVANWQEGQRLVVAREMLDRARTASDASGVVRAFAVPTVHATPYLAKPPMIYWAQCAAASLTGSRVELWHLRLVVALAGLAGVVATYFAARVILAPDRRGHPGLDGVPMDDRFADTAALWAGAYLATGVLAVRSGRIGELDILLVPFCTAAIGLVAAAWRRHRLERRTHPLALAGATLCTLAAMFTKDPGVLVVALGGYGAILAWCAFGEEGRPVSPARASVEWAVFAIGAIAGGVFASRTAESVPDALGVALIALACGMLARGVVRLSEPSRARAAVVALVRTHPWIVLGVPIALRLAWKSAVAADIGADQTSQLVAQEVEDNLRLFVAEAPLNNLEGTAFGVGLGSVLAIFGAIWLIQKPPRIPAGWFHAFAWAVLGLVAFSVLGKGVQRYLTPIWPAIAIVGGLTAASLLATREGRPGLRVVLVAALVALAAVQGWWYGYGRAEGSGDRSPRDLVRELVGERGVSPDELVSFEISTPALAYYADQRVEPIGETGVNASMSGGASWTLDEVRDAAREHGRLVALVRTIRLRSGEPDDAPARLRAAGFVLEPITTRARFIVDSGRSEVRAYVLTAP